MVTSLKAGDAAPSFALQDQDGVTRRLEDFSGKNVVLYFYPRDETPGCTTEACQFRDEHSVLEELGAIVLGVSRDDQASHKAFADHWELPFPLLVDSDTEISNAYGAWGEREIRGEKSIGMIRSTFLIGPDGNLAHVWAPVTADGHAEEVRRTIEELAK
ncbi:MAG: peroxiredoxin [Chloroflexota bacterium]